MRSTVSLAGRRVHVCAICFLAGAVTVQGSGELPSPWFSSVTLALFVLGVRFRWLLPLAFVSFGSSWAAFNASVLLDRNLPHELERKTVQVDAVVASLVGKCRVVAVSRPGVSLTRESAFALALPRKRRGHRSKVAVYGSLETSPRVSKPGWIRL